MGHWTSLCRHPLRVVLLSAALLASACVPPPSPAERLTDAAYQLNSAMRFGRMDVAVAYVVPEAQLDFAQRHANWGRGVRILDVDLIGMRVVGDDLMEVSVAVSWHPIDEMTIRQTQLAQRWKLSRDDWLMEEEQRIGGSPGLFLSPDLKREQRALATGS